jgi:hypothetical protein
MFNPIQGVFTDTPSAPPAAEPPRPPPPAWQAAGRGSTNSSG